MNFDLEYVEKLVKLISESPLTELSLEDETQCITLKKGVALDAVPVVQTQQKQVEAVKAELVQDVKPVSKGKPVKSPMVGTFYSASAPGEAAFVEVGQTVSKGQTLCIIEAMKLMNEIEAEEGGVITEICVNDGEPVEFGQVLMYIG